VRLRLKICPWITSLFFLCLAPGNKNPTIFATLERANQDSSAASQIVAHMARVHLEDAMADAVLAEAGNWTAMAVGHPEVEVAYLALKQHQRTADDFILRHHRRTGTTRVPLVDEPVELAVRRYLSTPNPRGELDVMSFRARRYSQDGGDGLLLALSTAIPDIPKFYVEFGSQNAIECSSRYLRVERRWQGILLDRDFENPYINQFRETMSKENINSVFAKYFVPREFGLLIIDIDGMDYHVLSGLTEFFPAILGIEIRAAGDENDFPVYESDFRWSGYASGATGCSLAAAARLARSKGYTLAALELFPTEVSGMAFFVRTTMIPPGVRFKYQDDVEAMRAACVWGDDVAPLRGQ